MNFDCRPAFTRLQDSIGTISEASSQLVMEHQQIDGGFGRKSSSTMRRIFNLTSTNRTVSTSSDCGVHFGLTELLAHFSSSAMQLPPMGFVIATWPELDGIDVDEHLLSIRRCNLSNCGGNNLVIADKAFRGCYLAPRNELVTKIVRFGTIRLFSLGFLGGKL